MNLINDSYKPNITTSESTSPEVGNNVAQRAVFVEPVISQPIDILEATKFFGDFGGSIPS
ncbi:MAG: hypothetical protein MSG64_03885 [Pyrinomonadaceae bacterium MAG19_C2-C3]|nr:hypothetical protein [Pyrinomonadaceae bacterium MAG19_C2-C3]